MRGTWIWILGLGIWGWQIAAAEYIPIFYITGENYNSFLGSCFFSVRAHLLHFYN